MSLFISERDACKLLNIKKDTLRKQCNQGKLKHKFTKKGNKRYYRIDLFSLPEELQNRYFDEVKAKDLDIQKPLTNEDARKYLEAPIWKKKKADKYTQILTLARGLKGNALKTFIDEWNYENPDMKTSYCRVLEARRIKREEGLNGLFAKYDNINRNPSPINDEDFETFKSMYLTENRTSAQSCWYYIKQFTKARGEDVSDFPICKTFLRRLRREIPKSAIYLARYGEAKWNSKYGCYVDRDYSDLEAGAMWVSDHSQLDVACSYEGKVVFPWVTVWRDMKTSKWLGWDLHVEYPNSDHIFKTFHQAADKFGVPEVIYMDNGKDYRSKDLAGGRKNGEKANLFSSNIKSLAKTRENSARTMTELLGVKVIYSIPYNPQSKPIERDFSTMHNYFCKHQVGYRGQDVTQRPEKLKKEIKQNKIMTFEKIKEAFDIYVEFVHNKRPSEGKVLKGRSSDEAWAQEFKVIRPVKKDLLKILCMRTSPVKTVTSNGIADGEFGLHYWNDKLYSEKGEKIYIKRNNEQYHKCLVFKAENDEYLCEATLECFNMQGDKISIVDKSTLKRIKAMVDKDNKYRRYDFKGIIYALLKVLSFKSKKIELKLTDSEIQALLKEERKMDDAGSKWLSDYADSIKQAEFENELEKMEHQVRTKIYLFESDKKHDLELLETLRQENGLKSEVKQDEPELLKV